MFQKINSHSVAIGVTKGVLKGETLSFIIGLIYFS